MVWGEIIESREFAAENKEFPGRRAKLRIDAGTSAGMLPAHDPRCYLSSRALECALTPVHSDRFFSVRTSRHPRHAQLCWRCPLVYPAVIELLRRGD
jgi:hypothetical protein